MLLDFLFLRLYSDFIKLLLLIHLLLIVLQIVFQFLDLRLLIFDGLRFGLLIILKMVHLLPEIAVILLVFAAHLLGNLRLELVLQPVNLLPQLLGLRVLLLALRDHHGDFRFLFLQRLDLILLFLALVGVLLVVLRRLLLLKDDLVLVQFRKLAHNLGHQKADLDLPLTCSILLAVVLGHIGDLRQGLRDAILDLLLLRLDVVRVALQACHLFLLNRRYALVAILFDQINFPCELLRFV